MEVALQFHIPGMLLGIPFVFVHLFMPYLKGKQLPAMYLIVRSHLTINNDFYIFTKVYLIRIITSFGVYRRKTRFMKTIADYSL